MLSPGLWLYILVGPLPVVGIVVLTLIGRRRLQRLTRSRVLELPTDPPRVTILVPVKDEAGGIEACLRGLLAQDYPADRFDLLCVDDRSTDGTEAILDHLADELGPRLRVMHLTDLPAGWLGKPHALHTATRDPSALGEWLLLVDSDVVCEPTALRQTLALAEGRGYAMLSLLTGLIAPTLVEQLVGPPAATLWLTTFRASDTNDDNRRDAALANGQFFLVRRDILAEAGGHPAVRDKTCEDVELARRIKANGHSVRLLLGGHLARTRMHTNWRQLLNGWARNFAGTARHRPTRLIVAGLLLLLALLPVPMAIVGFTTERIGFLAVAVVHFVAVAAWFAIAYRGSGRSWGRTLGLALLNPIGLIALLALLGNGIRACFGGTVTWRGSQVRA